MTLYFGAKEKANWSILPCMLFKSLEISGKGSCQKLPEWDVYGSFPK
jgi:hypothetical protein